MRLERTVSPSASLVLALGIFLLEPSLLAILRLALGFSLLITVLVLDKLIILLSIFFYLRVRRIRLYELLVLVSPLMLRESDARCSNLFFYAFLLFLCTINRLLGRTIEDLDCFLVGC